ncbi:glycine zipper 2TM domain-containing protein [Variovorax sp. GT1P44]|uniref:glycine zipper 2TM domain-containing protein n=1 Tax=Variovorax sp. GT1P44 TaxID=3443742 RepID=UPI003F4767D3
MRSASSRRPGAAADGTVRPAGAALCVLAVVLAWQPALAAPPDAVSKPCSVCGKVESVRKVQTAKPTSGVGAVAGGVVGGVLGHQVGSGRGRTLATVAGAGAGAFAGNTVEKKRNTSQVYEVSVRMQDGSMRTVKSTTAPPVGQAVTLKGDVLQPAGSKKK